jgi:hypothetical protein
VHAGEMRRGGANTYFFTNFAVGHLELFNGRGGSDTFDASRSDLSVWVSLDFNGPEVWSPGSFARRHQHHLRRQ